jgi:uncharacterized protein (TIGR02145 family)
MAENLNYETPNSWWYDNSSANGAVYGRLYTWDAALTACPIGWHLPSDEEWKTLEITLGMSQSEVDQLGWRGTDEGDKMKSTNGWSLFGNEKNSSGFTALPGGHRYFLGGFYDLDWGGEWWSSTEDPGDRGWFRVLFFSYAGVLRNLDNKGGGFSVRCVRD